VGDRDRRAAVVTRRVQQSQQSEPLERQLSGLAVWLLVINGVVGAGIYGLPGEAARLAGAFSPWVFVLCAVLMLPVMLSFAELASRFETTGGPVRYVGSVFGPAGGFLAGWATYVARLTAFSANAVLLVNAVGYFWQGADDPGTHAVLLLAVCAGLTAVTVLGTRNAMGSLAVLTALKLLPLVGLVILGLVSVPEAMLQGVQVGPPRGSDVGAAVLLVFYAFVGFESGLVPAGEASNPRRDIPRALLWSISMVAVLYFGLQAVSLATLPGLAGAKRPLVEVGGELLGPAGAVLMTAGLVASVGGNLSGTLFSAPRITYALGLDGSLPAWFARVSPRFRTPAVSIVVFGVAAFLLAVAGSFAWLAGLSVLTRVLIYVGCFATLPELRRRGEDAPGVLRLPGGLLIPACAVIICLALLTQVKAGDYVVTGAMLATGALLYALARRARTT
jgi:amino acid transporter